MDPEETFEHNGYTVQIIRDDEPDTGNPREFDNLGIMLATGHKRYQLGDQPFTRTSGDELDAAARELTAVYEGESNPVQFRRFLIHELGATVVLPLYLLDHSGLSMRTGPFAEDPGGWDSGIVGFIFDTAKTRETCGTPPERVEEVLRSEVAEYDMYLQGDVYGFQVLNLDGEEVESCWGFLGIDSCREAAREAVPDDAPPPATTAVRFTPAEMDYLARCVDLGRSDAQASRTLPPTGRDELLKKLGGRRD